LHQFLDFPHCAIKQARRLTVKYPFIQRTQFDVLFLRVSDLFANKNPGAENIP
jgi:hypothetical protein